jgi:ATPase involved in DNA repair
MKITKISLQGFRAFDETFELDLDGGKNLLLHGENGSGKSSIFIALKRFFEERGDDIVKYQNFFSSNNRSPNVQLCIKGRETEDANIEHQCRWNITDGHPLLMPRDMTAASTSPELRSLLLDASRRSGFLDYRVMLRTSLVSGPYSRSAQTPPTHNMIYGAESVGLEEQFFDLVSLVILAGVPVSETGGTQTTLGTIMRDVWNIRPVRRYNKDIRAANNVANEFNTAFNAKLPELNAKFSSLLQSFENHQLEISFQPISLTWEKSSLALRGAELQMEVKFRGKIVTNHYQFLNEARLSAIATCLFLAGVQLADNDYDNPIHPRFLVLDDALIGLELQNRLPVLHILTSEPFRNYQIFLFTHDRVWFDLARGHLRENAGWLHRELIADESTGTLIPKLRASNNDLERAHNHLSNGDLKAAAVYARSALEWKLRKVCQERGIKIPFKPDADKIGAGVLWDGILDRQRERERQRQQGSQVLDFLPRDLETEMEIMRSTVLNKLSHHGSSGLVPSEVVAALNTVERIHGHNFPN